MFISSFLKTAAQNTARSAAKHNTRRGLSLEKLEERQLFAGDLSAIFQNGMLTITEAPGTAGQDHQVNVSQVSSNVIRVTANTLTSRVNGSVFREFTIPGGTANATVAISTGGGNDLVQITNLNIKALDLNTGGTGPDHDRVIISGLKTTTNAFIRTGGGNDQVSAGNLDLRRSTIGKSFIDTGSGADVVTVGGGFNTIRGDFEVRTFLNAAEADVDKVTFDNLGLETASIHTGGGDDQVSINRVVSQGSLSMTTGEGKDNVRLFDVFARDQVFATLGGGDDTMSTEFLRTPKLFVHGDGGYDTLSRTSEAHHIGKTEFNTVEKVDGISVVPFRFTVSNVSKGSTLARATVGR